jgi:hypothetical protein
VGGHVKGTASPAFTRTKRLFFNEFSDLRIAKVFGVRYSSVPLDLKNRGGLISIILNNTEGSTKSRI